MKRNRSVFIAGAVIPWGASTTTELTNLLKDDEVFINDKGERIGLYLFDLLSSNTPDRLSPNFETILNFIEALYQLRNKDKPLFNSQLLKSSFRINDYCLINDNINTKLNSFEKSNPNREDGIFKTIFLNTAFGNHRHIGGYLFYQELYFHFVVIIIKRIQAYDNQQNLGSYLELNKCFENFLMNSKRNRGLLRYYTLNYDLLPFKIFNGFFDGYNFNGKIDLVRIIKENYIYVYYNLHGSIMMDFNWHKSGYTNSSSTPSTFDNNRLISSPIITGYNKIDRIFGQSYVHFYNKLIDDCYNADEIYLIGYSFGDKHINSAINGAMQIGKTKITLIDLLDVNDLNKRRSFVSNYNRTNPTNEYSLNVIEPINPQKVQLHLNGFKEYLENY